MMWVLYIKSYAPVNVIPSPPRGNPGDFDKVLTTHRGDSDMIFFFFFFCIGHAY